MPLTAHDLRYHAEQSFPSLYSYLHRHAQRYLGALKYDATEVDAVVGHVIEQLVRLGLLGCADKTPLNALDRLTEAQFYSFLNQSVKHKAIDRLRKRRLQISTTTELEGPDTDDADHNPLDEAVESIWGVKPFDSPEEIAIFMASQHDTRSIIKHCIMALKNAPHQLEAMLQELRDLGAIEILQELEPEIAAMHLDITQVAHLSQQKDHAHKKLRHCLQQQSTNLTVTVALRLTEYGTQTAPPSEYAVPLQTLAQTDLTIEDVQRALRQLVAEGLLDWQNEETVLLSKEQMRRLTRFYKPE